MAKIIPYAFFQELDNNGDILAGGKVYTYEAGTTTPKVTYTGPDETASNPNPVILDASGRAAIWLGEGAYKLVLTDVNDVEIETKDNITGGDTGEITSFDLSTNTAITQLYENGRIYATNSITLSLLAAADATDGFEFIVKNVGSGSVILDPDASETINSASTFTLEAGRAVRVMCDGSEWYTFGDIADDSITLAKLAPGTAGNLITYDAAGDPAAVATGDADQVLTSNGAGAAPTFQTIDQGFPLGYKYGGILSNGTDAAHDIDVTAGNFRDAADTVNIQLSAITKRIDATWSAGTGNGGRSSSVSLSSNTWYHVFAIIVGGSADVGFDTSITAANLVTDHSATAYRYLGSVRTNGSANIIAFNQHGNRFIWQSPPLDINTSEDTTANTRTLASVPTGLEVFANLTANCSDGRSIYISSLNQDNLAPSTTAAPLVSYDNNDANRTPTPCDVMTNTSAQIRTRASGAVTNMRIVTRGWEVLQWP